MTGAVTRSFFRRRSALGGLLAAAALLLVSCGGDEPTEPAASPEPSATAPTTTPGVVVTGLEVPWGLAFEESGSALVTERDRGRLFRVTPDGDIQQVANFSDEIQNEAEGGLLGVAVSPSGATYVYLTTDSDNRVARVVEGDLTPVLTGIPRSAVHNGGRIAFGPDGFLYVATGDAGDPTLSPRLDSLAGKILRITENGDIPADNPFPDSPVYSLGHRNVQGLAWDSAGRLWATEFGSSLLDEVNLIRPGLNYGWPTAEGPAPAGTSGFEDPEVVWPVEQASPSGAAIVADTLYVAALRGQRLWAVPLQSNTAGEPSPMLEGTYGRIRTVEADASGLLWIMTSNRDGRGDPAATDDRIVVLRPGPDGSVQE